jgi:heat shock protein HtpX
MWELIRQNRRKSAFLFLIMGTILMLSGYIFGRASLGIADSGIIGMLLAALFWAVWSIISYIKGNSIIMFLNHAKKIESSMYPQLYNVVEEMKLAASLPAMPEIYVIDDFAPNAFATGRSPQKSAIAVTIGLLEMLNRDELQGVIAHEIAHILNRDTLYMTFAGLMLGTINIFSRGFLWSNLSGGRVRYQSSKGNVAGKSTPFMLFAVIFALLAPIMTRIFYFSLSKKREYLADATAIRLTRFPEGLANALSKMSASRLSLSVRNATTVPMYIVKPYIRNSQLSGGSSMFSTHPPIHKRIRILRSVINSVNYDAYQKAFLKTEKGKVIPGSALVGSRKNLGIRKPSQGADVAGNKRDIGDLIRAVNGFVFLTCICGLKMKLPPKFKHTEVNCPRCKRKIVLPFKKIAMLMPLLAKQRDDKKNTQNALNRRKEFTYKRKTKGWETFLCGNCHLKIQLSPSFIGKKIRCRNCKSNILVE